MMKKIVNNIPLLAFVLAAASALAFNMPAQQAPEFADHPQAGEIEVTDWDIGTDYLCNPGDECTYDENGETVKEGTFVPLRDPN